MRGIASDNTWIQRSWQVFRLIATLPAAYFAYNFAIQISIWIFERVSKGEFDKPIRYFWFYSIPCFLSPLIGGLIAPTRFRFVVSLLIAVVVVFWTITDDMPDFWKPEYNPPCFTAGLLSVGIVSGLDFLLLRRRKRSQNSKS